MPPDVSNTMSKIIVTAAVTGGDVKPSMTPYLPITPEQISEEAVKCVKEGASIIHIHARDPATGEPTSRTEIFFEIARLVKKKCDAVVNTTTGGSRGMTMQQRIAVVRELKPEMASLNMGSMNFYVSSVSESWGDVFENTFREIEFNAKTMQENGTKPECEIYDLGMLENLRLLVEKEIVRSPVHLQFVLGVTGGARASLETASFLRRVAMQYFPTCTWSTCAIGRYEIPLITWALLEGGNIRVGLEDNIYLSKGNLARGNAELVAKAVRILRELGHEPTTPTETRQILGLKGLDRVNF